MTDYQHSGFVWFRNILMITQPKFQLGFHFSTEPTHKWLCSKFCLWIPGDSLTLCWKTELQSMFAGTQGIAGFSPAALPLLSPLLLLKFGVMFGFFIVGCVV
ncbi:hypothetical protein AQUCO_07800036v1 [Aquilegia coerulea]|uniref:Uncharacterized protein n=1 Tax=Aquilegia coerulea TaxID=218851 RepID=A0A2G5C813_AQUCA|nr:hypothetical protein AQUCO_07800036v1 [Aquilegia coerulea]